MMAETSLADLELAIRWRTPPDLFAALDAEFHFTIDAAADATSTLCDQYYGPGSPLAQNALTIANGSLPGPAFLNFPYSTRLSAAYSWSGRFEHARMVRTETWVKWAATEGQFQPVVGIVPANWDTQWWVEYVWGHAAEIRCLNHRIQFIHPITREPATQPRDKHAIVIWKPRPGHHRPTDPKVRYWEYRKEHIHDQ